MTKPRSSPATPTARGYNNWGRARTVLPAGTGQLAVQLRPITTTLSNRDPAIRNFLLAMTLGMNAIAIWIRYRFRRRINW